jgi:uncharacterized protein YraI
MNTRYSVVLRGIMLGLLVIALMISLMPAAAQGGVLVQTGNNLRLRSTPSTAGAVLATVPFETTLSATAISGDREWVVVSYNGQGGWLALAYLSVVSGSLGDLPVSNQTFTGGEGGGAAGAVQIAGTVNLRLRSGPSTNDRIIGAIPFNTPVPALALSQDGRWVQTSYGGLTGWVAREYVVEVAGSLNSLTGQPSAGGSGATGSNLRGMFVAIDGTTYQHGWQAFVPAEYRADTAQAARMVVYIRENRVVLETCAYSGGGRTATLTRYRIEYTIRLVDQATGQPFDERTFGRDPEGCPDSRWFSSSNEALEAYPIFEEVWPWLLEKLNLIGG